MTLCDACGCKTTENEGVHQVSVSTRIRDHTLEYCGTWDLCQVCRRALASHLRESSEAFVEERKGKK